MLAFESSHVIALRLAKLASGEAGEATLMVTEKIDAFFDAGATLSRTGNFAMVIERYRQHVAANAARLASY